MKPQLLIPEKAESLITKWIDFDKLNFHNEWMNSRKRYVISVDPCLESPGNMTITEAEKLAEYISLMGIDVHRFPNHQIIAVP